MIRSIALGFFGVMVLAGCLVALIADDVVWSIGGLVVAVASALLVAAVSEERR